ncbi:hypothetical protein Tco_1160627, partial [Tanacetum coccineum]
GNPISSLTSHTDLTSPEVNDDIFDPEGDIIKNLLNLDKPKDLPPYHDNPSSGNPTPILKPVTNDSFPSGNDDLVDTILEEFTDELALITFPLGNDDMTPEDVIKEIECLLNQSPLADYSPSNDLVNTIPEMFVNEHDLDYSSPPLWDDYDDELFDHETVNDYVYDDPFDFKEVKINDSKILFDELDSPESSDFLPFPECDLVFYEDFSEVDALLSTNNEDKVFNPGILIHENLFQVTNCATPENNVKKATHASLILEDFNPLSLHELPFQKEVPGSRTLLSFSSENEEKVFNLGVLTSKGVHTYLLSGLSHRGSKAFKVIKILKSPMEIFPCSYGEDIRVLDVLIAWILEASRARGFVLRSLELHILSFILRIRYLNLID